MESFGTSSSQAQEIEHAIRHELRIPFEKKPVVYESLRKRLEELIALHRQQRITDLELLTGEIQLRDEMIELQHGDTAHNLQVYERPFFNTLQPMIGDAASAAELARDVVTCLQQQVVIDWTSREAVKREMRRQVTDLLRKRGISNEAVEVLAPKLIALAEQWLRA